MFGVPLSPEPGAVARRASICLSSDLRPTLAGSSAEGRNMTYLKPLGLAAIAALTSVALIAASPASATQSTALCIEPSVTLACPAGKLTTTLHAVATTPLWDSSIANIKCASSLFKASVLGLGTAPTAQVIHLEELTWTGCETHGGTACEVKTLLLGLINLLKLSTKDAHATSTGGTVVNLHCGAFINCSYGGNTILLMEDPTGSSGADLKANTVVNADTVHPHSFCSSTVTFLALYINLVPVYIRS